MNLWIFVAEIHDNAGMQNDSFPMDLVVPGLHVGPAPTSLAHFQFLRQRGVKAILTLETEAEASAHGLLPEVALRVTASLGISLDRVPIPDLDPGSLRRLLGAAVMRLDEIHRRAGQVYLHCTAGIQRSPTVAAAWIAWRRSLDAVSACELVRRAHPSVPDVEAVNEFLGRMGRV